jgi:MoaA/NifB/PqqE/SkfB family radical SAM enzyme
VAAIEADQFLTLDSAVHFEGFASDERTTKLIRARLSGHYRESGRYPSATVNVTNQCNLACEHCFVYRTGNPNATPRSIRGEMSDDDMLETLAGLRDRHGISSMLWMGGEPLLKRRLLARGIRLFARNTITTNGTIPLPDFGSGVHYVVSLDGPEELNDSLRGAGTFRRVMTNLSRLKPDMVSTVQVQCVVTRKNQHQLSELVDAVRTTPVGWMTFSFYVPRKEDDSGNAWSTNAERVPAIREVQRLKAMHNGFIRNTSKSLELMLPPACDAVTKDCPTRKQLLPLWLENNHFSTPFCCYGNDVDCSKCGAWVVFELAARQARSREH